MSVAALSYSGRFLFTEFLESGIGAQRIPDRIESQCRRSKKRRLGILCPQQPLEHRNRVIGITQLCVDTCHVVLQLGTKFRIFGTWQQADGFLAFSDSGSCFAQTCVGRAQKNASVWLETRIRLDLLELAAKAFDRLLVRRACCCNIAGESLAKSEQKNVRRIALLT